MKEGIESFGHGPKVRHEVVPSGKDPFREPFSHLANLTTGSFSTEQ